ncbi:hypothetical protein [Microseira wollei]|uniref:hypothetical protein n=1 Tax=Microseira wollei TaxID=467598 RepID=UPI001CFD4176|nr:hypothetical protein [Microseira wollei]
MAVLVPSSLNAEGSSSSSEKQKPETSKNFPELLVSNLPGILTGIAGIITAIYTDRKSSNKQQELQRSLDTKLARGNLDQEITTALKSDEFRQKLLDILIRDQLFIGFIKNLGQFTTVCDVTGQIKDCQSHFDERLKKSLIEPTTKSFIQSQGFVTGEQINRDLEKIDVSTENGRKMLRESFWYLVSFDPDFQEKLRVVILETAKPKEVLELLQKQILKP